MFKSGWAVQYFEEEAKICIYTLGSKRTHYDFQPTLKKIIEDAFDSKVRSWLNSIDYVEDEDERERVKSLVVQEIRRFNKWLFSSDCDIKTAAAGIQSRYLLLGTGLSEPKLSVSVANEKDRAESQQVLLQTYKDAVRDKLSFPTTFWEYPAFILLCILSHEGQKAFWASLTSDAPVNNSTSTMNAIEGLIRNKSVFDAKAIQDSLTNTPTSMALLRTPAYKREMTTIDIVVRKFAGQNNTEIKKFLVDKLTRIRSLVTKKNSSHGGQGQKGALADDWKSYFYRLIFVCTDKKSKQNLANKIIFTPESDFHESSYPTGFDTFCEAFVASIVPADEMNWNFQSQLKAGVLKGPMQKSEPLTSAVSKDGKKLTGMDAIYDEYREEAEEPRKFRLGQDLLSMHDINPIASSFYEAARLEAYFRAKSSESRTYKKRRTEDAFSGYDEEFSRVAHRQGMFRHPLIERKQEKQAVLDKAISMVILPSTPREWYKNGNCFVKDKGAALEPEADIVYKAPIYGDSSSPADEDLNASTSSEEEDDEDDSAYEYPATGKEITLHSNHVSEHLFQQEHAYALWSFDRGIKGVEEPSEDDFDWFLNTEEPPVPEFIETPASKPKEYVLLPVTTGGLILSEVFVDTKKYWLVGDTFSLYSDALTLCLKFVNRFRNKDYAANAEYIEEEGGDEDDGQRGPREVLRSLDNESVKLRNDLFFDHDSSDEKTAVSNFFQKVQNYEEKRSGFMVIDASHMNRAIMTQTKCIVHMGGAKNVEAENSDFHFGKQTVVFHLNSTTQQQLEMDINLNRRGFISEVYVQDQNNLLEAGNYFVTKTEGTSYDNYDILTNELVKLESGEMRMFDSTSGANISKVWTTVQYLIVEVQKLKADLSESSRSLSSLNASDETQFEDFNFRVPYFDSLKQGFPEFEFTAGEPYEDNLLSSGTKRADPSILNVWDTDGSWDTLSVQCTTVDKSHEVIFSKDEGKIAENPYTGKAKIVSGKESKLIHFNNGTAQEVSDNLSYTRFPVRVRSGVFTHVLTSDEIDEPKKIGKYATVGGAKTIRIEKAEEEEDDIENHQVAVDGPNGLKLLVTYDLKAKIAKDVEIIRPGYNIENNSKISSDSIKAVFEVTELIGADDDEANYIEYFYHRKKE